MFQSQGLQFSLTVTLSYRLACRKLEDDEENRQERKSLISVFLKLGIMNKRWQMSGRINKAIVI